MMAYQYRGTIHDLDEPVQSRRPPSDVFDPSRCGTYAGYKQHQNRGIPACQDCKDAQAAYSRDRWHAVGGYSPASQFNPARCGTFSGYKQHKDYRQPACDACRAAYAAYMRDYRARRSAERSSAT